jgi:DNA helicase HerA-like ATPase
MPMRLPTDQQRTAIIGSTGSGKTQFACWLLSTRDFTGRPWIIFDYKGDELIDKLGAKEIKITDKPPTKPGLYVVRPLADTETEAVEKFLWAVHRNGDTGIYIDEGYMIGKSSAFRALLTQGRSKHIPMIVLSQRPAWISRFVFSEANFFAIFRLTDEDDVKEVKRFIGPRGRALVNHGLPAYHCVWFDVGGGAGHGNTVLCAPVPSAKEIVATFRAKLGKNATQKRVI